MPSLTPRNLTELLLRPSPLRTGLHGLALTASRGSVGGLALSPKAWPNEVVRPECEHERDVPSWEFLERLSALTLSSKPNDYGGANAALMVTSRSSSVPDAELIHPVQLRHYANSVATHPRIIGGSISAARNGTIRLDLFASRKRARFSPVLLQTLPQNTAPSTVNRVIKMAKLVVVPLTFNSATMEPESGIENIPELF